MEAIAAASGAGGAHPSADELLSYNDGKLEAAEREQVVWHLAACADCAQAVLDMARFPEVEALNSNQQLSSADVAERWGRLRDRLRSEQSVETVSAVKAPVVEIRQRSRSWVYSLSFARTAAAALLVVTVGLSATIFSMRRNAREEAGPRLNLPIVELAAQGAVNERAEEDLKTLHIPAGADGALLVLTLVDPRSYPNYRIEIRDASAPQTDPLWHSTDLQRSPEGIFTLEIRRGFLPAGRYQIEVRGLDEDRRELLATYLLAIEYE